MSASEKQIIVIKTDIKFGLWGLIIGFVGIFVFSIVLSPLAFILGLVGFFRGQIFSGIIAILFSIIGLLTSPIFMGFLGWGVLISFPDILNEATLLLQGEPNPN